MIPFGQILQRLRNEKRWSQSKLAEKLGVSRQTIISIEKGRYNPSLPLAMILAELFETTVEKLFFLEAEDYKKI